MLRSTSICHELSMKLSYESQRDWKFFCPFNPIIRGFDVVLERGLVQRSVDRVLGGDQPALVATAGARGELVSLDQRDLRAGARQLQRARGADDPASHDDDVGHGRSVQGPRPRPVDSLTETWLSGRKQPPAKRLGV